MWELSYNLVNFCSLDVDSGTNIGMVLVCLEQRAFTCNCTFQTHLKHAGCFWDIMTPQSQNDSLSRCKRDVHGSITSHNIISESVSTIYNINIADFVILRLIFLYTIQAHYSDSTKTRFTYSQMGSCFWMWCLMGNSTPNSEILYLLMLFEKCPLPSPGKRQSYCCIWE